jgi:ABC-type amino acid transport substrate-binding protein
MLEKDLLDGLVSTASYNENDQLDMLWQSDRLYHSEVSAFSLVAFQPEHFLDKRFLMNTNYRLGVLNEFSYMVDGTELALRDNLIKVHRDQQLVDLLMIGRVDLIISEDISFIYTARLSGKFENIKPVLEITSRPVSIALAKKVIDAHPDFVPKINDSILLLRKSGFIDSVIVKYLRLE